MALRLAPISILMIASVASAAPVAHRASLMDGSISSADYPPAAIAAHEVGTVVAAYRIAPDGTVAKCDIAQASGSDALDARTCEIILQRFRFNPARNAAGDAIEEWRTQKISWKLPVVADGYANASRKGELLVYVTKDGSVDTCEVLKPSGDKAWDLKMCRLVASSQKFKPTLDFNGRPQKSKHLVPVWE